MVAVGYGPSMTARTDLRVPGWALVSAVAAPVSMIGGWTLAGSRQQSFDAVGETISALAASGATAPWIMSAALAGTGIAHVVTAAGLRPVPRAARALQALGGAATVVVAALPVDVWPRAHGAAAAVGFGALALWPACAWRRGLVRPPPPRRIALARLRLAPWPFRCAQPGGRCWSGDLFGGAAGALRC